MSQTARVEKTHSEKDRSDRERCFIGTFFESGYRTKKNKIDAHFKGVLYNEKEVNLWIRNF